MTKDFLGAAAFLAMRDYGLGFLGWGSAPYVFKRDPEVDELLKSKAQEKRDRKAALRVKHYTGARS